MARLDPAASGFPSLQVWRAPLFCLDGSIYPVDHEFDWSRDTDVLTDVIRDTHISIRMHTFAKASDDRSWFHCDCVDLDDHIGLLTLGLSLMQSKLTAHVPDIHTPELARRAPVVIGTFMRAVHVFVFAVLTAGVIDSAF